LIIQNLKSFFLLFVRAFIAVVLWFKGLTEPLFEVGAKNKRKFL
jgi:hypothetical protein